MAGQLYRVVFQGEILEGREVQEVKKALAKMYNTGEDQIERFFSGKRLAVKKDVEYETAMKYVKAFEQAGALCRLEELETHTGPEQPLMLEKEAEEAEASRQDDDVMVCPKCQFEQAIAEDCVRCGIIISKYSEKLHEPESQIREERFEARPASGGSKLLAIAAVVLVAFLAIGFYYFSGTPRYSLYKLGRAVKNHDSEAFHKYVDVDRIVDHLAEFAVQQIAAQMEENQPTGDWGRPAEEFDKELAMMMLPGMLEALKPQIRQAITEFIENEDDERKGSALVGASLAGIETEGNTSLVTVEHEETGEQIRFKMEKSPGRYWRIVEIDLESFQKLSEK